MSSNLPKISVITVSYNQGEFIRDCIESVKNQDYPNIEHIIVDGGSTDNTIDILKQYAHLNWVSEPDNGQTHALNKGFKKATGQIIGWLNSDDYYVPGALKIVASQLSEYPVLLAGGNIVDRHGNITGYVPNIERNWFDILKNWIYHSSFLQPAVFFTKQVLDSVKLDDGNYLDEDLHYVMDYELWLRIALKFPFAKRAPIALSCFRVYEESKTGTAKFSTDHEIRRVYQKYSSLMVRQECSTSYILSVETLDRSVFVTLDSINSQSYFDQEVVIAFYECDQDINQSLQKLKKNFPRLVIRSVDKSCDDYVSATKHAVAIARGAICMLMQSGCVVNADFNLNLIQYFASQSLGAIIPSLGDNQKIEAFSANSNGVPIFNAQALLSEFSMPLNIAFRKVALLELGEVFNSPDILHFIRSELFGLLYKGWGINVSNVLEIKGQIENPFDQNVNSEPLKLSYAVAKMICDNHDSKQNDPFNIVRTEHGFSLGIPTEYVESCRKFLAEAGEETKFKL